jgi:hypothetical protein
MVRRALVVAVVSAAVLGLSGVAAAAPPEGSLRLTVVPADEGGLGPRSFFFTETVYQGGKVVGSDRAVCRFTANFENPRCRITLSLPGGRLFLFLRITPDPRGNVKVTGGTGTYRGRTGVGIYRSLGPNATRVVIWLTSQRAP